MLQLMRTLLITGAAVVLVFTIVTRLLPERSTDTTLIDQAIEELEWQAKHLEPGSARSMKTQRKLERWRSKRDGRPSPDRPDEFARILAEMRVPSDRSVSEY